MELTRRDVLAACLGLPALAAGCDSAPPRLPPHGRIVGPSGDLGHRLRDGFRPRPADDEWQAAEVVIVGGGVAGLSAAWRLRRARFDDFTLLELEAQTGGTSQSGELAGIPCPWGAHYLPAPRGDNPALVLFLEELGLVEGRDAAGEPIYPEQHLCRDPQERVFHDGLWHEGLYLDAGADERDRREWAEFQQALDRWVGWRDGHGRRAFTIPVAACSDDAAVSALDELSMSDWLAAQGFTSRRLLWLVDYACRDDYGLRSTQTSAWAGLFYFASRIGAPGREPQPLLTWPEGNGRLVRFLHERSVKQIRTGWGVSEIIPSRDPADPVRVVAVGGAAENERVLGVAARQVIFCAPHFLAPHLIHGFREARGAATAEFQYGSWLVANLHLAERPAPAGFPPSWDNVIYDSPALGYVTATHQQGMDHGPTVFTWYLPLCDEDPRAARARLQDLDWAACAELCLADLERAHPDLRTLVTRLDVMRWGHAMVRPTPGFVRGAACRGAAEPFGPVHFAHCDLSGIPLFEEAFYHGVRAAEEVLRLRGEAVETIL